MVMPWPPPADPGSKSAITLLVMGFFSVVLAFLAAFTTYGEIAAVVGVACIVVGAVLLAKQRPSKVDAATMLVDTGSGE